MPGQPWASGPREILQHGLSLLRDDTDANRRLALLSIDNAVELAVKTFLGLPWRLSEIRVPRKELAEASESFPKLLDALENYAQDRLDGVDLGEIEWFHRLRNQLYHQGNGLTVDRDKVEIYAELAKLLFRNLFGDTVEVATADRHALLGEFLAEWVTFERTVSLLMERENRTSAVSANRAMPPVMTYRRFFDSDLLDPGDIESIDGLRQLRNSVVHGQVDYRTAVTKQAIESLRGIAAKYAAKLDSK